MRTNLTIVGVALLSALVACTPDPVQPEPPITDKPGEQPTDKPAPPTQKPDSVYVFKKTRISWAETDFQEIEYDASNLPIRYTRQNLYAQGTDRVRKVVYELSYNTARKLTRVTASNGAYVDYAYQGNQVSRTDEFTGAGQLVNTRLFRYGATNQLERIQETQVNGTRTTERNWTFTYDTKGNLTQRVETGNDEKTGTSRVSWIVRYTKYDSYQNVTNLFIDATILPNVTFMVNNPGRVAVYAPDADGSERLVQYMDYAYQYNEQGYPVSHVQSDGKTTLRATYSYMGW